MFRQCVVVAAAIIGGAVAFPILHGLEGKLSSKYGGFPQSAIRAALLDAVEAVAADEGVPLHDATCARNFAVCPIDWTASTSGTCSPPSAYNGDCDSLDLNGLTPVERSRAAGKCDAIFPCLDTCSKGSCPQGWDHQGDSCSAPASYTGACVSNVKFPQMSAALREKYETICGVSFCEA